MTIDPWRQQQIDKAKAEISLALDQLGERMRYEGNRQARTGTMEGKTRDP